MQLTSVFGDSRMNAAVSRVVHASPPRTALQERSAERVDGTTCRRRAHQPMRPALQTDRDSLPPVSGGAAHAKKYSGATMVDVHARFRLIGEFVFRPAMADDDNPHLAPGQYGVTVVAASINNACASSTACLGGSPASPEQV